ncbi:MAG: serine/threonine protein kinase [Burkholderiales bacterium]|nr:serine/threonine protein kinase [Burkholderiales bacterium]
MSDAARALPEHVSALPPGTRLGEFEVRGLLGVGGFGIVYLAFDHALEREVAIKEYMPASMAGRTETLHVSLRSQGDAEVFALGLRSFVNEAKLLARFDHPSLIKVHRFWEANGTAYMAMPVLRGSTLKDIRRSTGRGPDEAWVRAMLAPLLGALEQLHNEGVYHRDIAPDNIHLEGDGRPVLLDFGAARRVISGKTQTLTAILKPAYAPIEQYAESGAVKQGPWTDIYALGATLHYMLLGHPPAPATARTVADEASGLMQQTLPGCSPQLLAVIDWMLAPRPAERPQSVAALRAVLEGRAPLPQRAAAAPPAGAWDKTAISAPAVTVPLGEIGHTDLELDMSADPPAVPRRPDSRDGEHTRSPARGLAQRAESLPMAADDSHRLQPPPSRARLLPMALTGLVLAGVLGYAGWAQLGPADGGVAPPGAAAAAGPGPTTAPAAVPPATATAPANTTGATGTTSSAGAPPAVMPTATSGPADAGAAAAPGTPTPRAGAVPGAPPVPTALPATPAPRAGRASDAGSRTGAGARAAPSSPLERSGPQAPVGPRGTGATPSNAQGASPSAQGATNAPGPAGTGTAPPAATAPVAPAAAPPTATAPRVGTPPSPAPSAAEPAAGATPEGLCSGRNPLSHFVCMERECLRSRFRNHAECLAWRQQARPRDAAGN